MTRSEVEAIEAAWRVLERSRFEAAKPAADALVAFLDEIDDAGVIDELNRHRGARDIMASIAASCRRRR